MPQSFVDAVGKEQQIIIQLLWDVRIWFKALMAGKFYDVNRGFMSIVSYANKTPKNEINMFYCRLSFKFCFTTFFHLEWFSTPIKSKIIVWITNASQQMLLCAPEEFNKPIFVYSIISVTWHCQNKRKGLIQSSNIQRWWFINYHCQLMHGE